MTIAPTRQRQTYANAPIVEAVIDLRVTHAADVDSLVDVETCADVLSANFPRKQPIEKVMLAADAQDGQITTRPPEHERMGWSLFSANNDRILKLRKDGFTYSHLPPYTQWDTFRKEAEPLWSEYVKVCKPRLVTRIAVRYINRLKMPPGEINLNDFLTIYPEVPRSIQSIEGLMMRIQASEPDLPGKGNSFIMLASEQPQEIGHQPMILDFDIVSEIQMEPTNPDIWHLLEKLRDKKNDLFEACLTERMKELFA